ncbi:hypothetical protein PM082_023764 [Marasmius tenuissimus]|nr:hypothetical protein PM082_023764 [Marasmius tenuissimus]
MSSSSHSYYYCEPSTSKHHHLNFHSHRRSHHDEHDLSRLLDPAYARPSSSSQTRVYKDHHGEFHDPDYRHFPATSPSSARNRRVNSGASLTRPSWEMGSMGMDEAEFEALYNDGDDEVQVDDRSSRRRSGSRNTYTSTSAYSTPTYTYPSSSSSYTYNSSSSSPSSSPSTIATSLSDSELPSYSSPSSSCPVSNKLTKRLLSRTTGRSSFEEHVHPYEVDQEDIADSISLNQEPEPQSPTSGESRSQSMKKQWHAMQLSVRFGVFRAQRRFKEALAKEKR